MLIVVAAVGFAVYYAVVQKKHKSGFEAAPVPGPPGAITKKYADALKVAMQFLDVQKC